jgi:hypothetical protein
MSLYAGVYVQSRLGKSELLGLISEKLGGQIDFDSMTTFQMDIYLDENEQYDQEKIKRFPDGFLYFRYLLDVDQSDVGEDRIYMEQLSQLLEFLWSIDTPAVAACDFEQQLPKNGGYRNELLPWPQ